MTEAIHIQDLQFSWDRTSSPLLDIGEFSVRKSETLFLCGPSGSGKSTFLNLVGGVLSPNKGSIRVLDHEYGTMNHGKRDRFRGDHMGFIFQMFNLIPYLPVIENVVLPCRFSGMKTSRALQNSPSLEQEAERLLAHLNLDVANIRNRPVTELSVGQQQRVATARALMGKPEIIIADEPTSALDTDTRDAFLRLLFEECQAQGATLVFVSHDAGLGERFDRTIQLRDLNQRGQA
jgi:putative ABC transport system ATP-binding protein